uniref:Uncharacterized protein n=1 Tax=Nyssomyia neivai TaxID=330878 RepID=A0A1L8D8K1_9DIPT
MNNSTVIIGSTVPILERNQSTSNTFSHQAPYSPPYTPVHQTRSTTSYSSPYDPIKNNNCNEPFDYYRKQPYAPTAPTTLTNSDSNYSPKTPQNNYYNDLRKSANQNAPNPPAKPKKKSMCLIM